MLRAIRKGKIDIVVGMFKLCPLMSLLDFRGFNEELIYKGSIENTEMFNPLLMAINFKRELVLNPLLKRLDAVAVKLSLMTPFENEEVAEPNLKSNPNSDLFGMFLALKDDPKTFFKIWNNETYSKLWNTQHLSLLIQFCLEERVQKQLLALVQSQTSKSIFMSADHSVRAKLVANLLSMNTLKSLDSGVQVDFLYCLCSEPYALITFASSEATGDHRSMCLKTMSRDSMESMMDSAIAISEETSNITDDSEAVQQFLGELINFAADNKNVAV